MVPPFSLKLRALLRIFSIWIFQHYERIEKPIFSSRCKKSNSEYWLQTGDPNKWVFYSSLTIICAIRSEEVLSRQRQLCFEQNKSNVKDPFLVVICSINRHSRTLNSRNSRKALSSIEYKANYKGCYTRVFLRKEDYKFSHRYFYSIEIKMSMANLQNNGW